jgi:hypothetical protein
MYIKDGAVPLLKLGDVAEFLVAIACSFRRDSAARERVSRLHAAQTVGDHNGDRVLRSSEIVVKCG